MNETNCVNKLLEYSIGSSVLHYDVWSNEHSYNAVGDAARKKWISNILPSELLKRSLKRAVDSIVTLSEAEIFYREFPCCNEEYLPFQMSCHQNWQLSFPH